MPSFVTRGGLNGRMSDSRATTTHPISIFARSNCVLTTTTVPLCVAMSVHVGCSGGRWRPIASPAVAAVFARPFVNHPIELLAQLRVDFRVRLDDLNQD